MVLDTGASCCSRTRVVFNCRSNLQPSRLCIKEVGEDIPLETVEKSSEGKERGEDVAEMDMTAREKSSDEIGPREGGGSC